MKEIQSFADAEVALEQFIRPQDAPGGYTLDAIKGFLQSIGNPQDKYKVIHIAGTSGKTSTCYYIASLLNGAGYKVGHTVSPHVDTINERAQLNMQPLPESEYCSRLTAFLKLVAGSGFKLSYFETHIAFAYWLFAEESVDYAVVEVGLGGLLDGTNTINRADKVCVITDIGFDHTEILGDSIEEITQQKAGIIQAGNSVYMNEQSSEVAQIISRTGHDNQATVHIVRPHYGHETAALPSFQRRNFSLALTVADAVVAQDDSVLNPSIVAAAVITYVPARMEVVQYLGKTIILDGSHNSQKMQALVDAIADQFPSSSIHCLVSIGRTKRTNVDGVLTSLETISDTTVLTAFSGTVNTTMEPIEPSELVVASRTAGFDNVSIESNPEVAFAELVSSSAEVVLVTGSFFLLNHIRPLLKLRN